MFSNIRQRATNELTRKETRRSSGHQKKATSIEDGRGKRSGKAILAKAQEPSGISTTSPSIVHRKAVKTMVIGSKEYVFSVGFLFGGNDVLSGGWEGKVRRWRMEDGTELGMPMDTGSAVLNMAVSRDGALAVSGTRSGEVMVWNAKRREKVTEFIGHEGWVNAVDVSPDATRIATGSDDKTACIWSLSTGQRLLGPLEHDGSVVTAKFSPDGRLVATATLSCVRVYSVRDGRLVVQFPVQVFSAINQSVAWASDGGQLFALSRDGNIHSLEVSTWTLLPPWPIHSSNNARCIAMASNGMFIATSAGGSVSFWDTTTREQIGFVVEYTHEILSMAISTTHDLVTTGDKTISFCSLNDVLPPSYFDDLIAKLQKMIQELRFQVSESQTAHREKDNATQSLRTRDESSSSRIACLEKTVQELRNELAELQCAADRQRNSLNEVIKLLRSDLHTLEVSSNEKIVLLEQTNRELQVQLAASKQKADSSLRTNNAHEQKYQCEFFHPQGGIHCAAESVLEMASVVSEDLRDGKLTFGWLAEFTRRCIVTLQKVGDEASNAEKWNEAVAACSAALSLNPSASSTVLVTWARMVLIDGSVHEVLTAAAKFNVSRLLVYRVICDILESDGRLTEAVKCFLQMQNDSDLADNTGSDDERAQWDNFRGRCAGRLERLGDAARDSQKHNEAIEHYSNALSLNPTNFNDILLKRSDELIAFDPSSYKGYEGKHAVLHRVGRYSEAVEAFKMMLSNLERSPDPGIRELRHKYVDATTAIRNAVEQAIRHIPRVLIDSETGRLYDKAQQAAAFEELPIYDKLRSSMTTQLDDSRIQREVKEFYRYVMLSHKWQASEPTFQQIESSSVHKLPASPTFSKLQNFCKLVCSLRFKWAWSDTCCVNQLDKGVQQESLVAMFRWYRGSSLTIIHLLGVLSESQKIGCLWKSIWNTRAWTYQEYVASEVVQFYTEDWKPYLGLSIFNHKESPIILSEMERAMNFTMKELASLQPGLDRVREKLYLASVRQTTREEDIAYSLFGIFNVALPIIYGEGNQAVGRLLEHILTRSDNVTLLAWTGSSGSHHSYLPADLTVYNQIVPPHVPLPIETTEMGAIVTALRTSLVDPSLAVVLYERLNNLPPLSLVAGRLRLPGIVFSLDDLVPLSDSEQVSGLHVYHATTPMLGNVEIRTKADLSGMEGLHLIHPWISPLLDGDFSSGVAQFDLTTRALRLIVLLRQPFGALLLAPLARAQYRRIATDSLIMVRVREETSLGELMDGIRTVDIQ